MSWRNVADARTTGFPEGKCARKPLTPASRPARLHLDTMTISPEGWPRRRRAARNSSSSFAWAIFSPTLFE